MRTLMSLSCSARGSLQVSSSTSRRRFPRRSARPCRLTYLDRLMKYRLVLEDGGTVRMRTDCHPFRDFSLTQLNLAGYQLEWETDDVRVDVSRRALERL